MTEKELRVKAVDMVIQITREKGVKLRRSDFDEDENDFYNDKENVTQFKNCVRMLYKDELLVGVIVKVAYKGRWENQLKAARPQFETVPNTRMEENHLVFGFTVKELDSLNGNVNKNYETVNIFDMIQSDVPKVNEKGYIPSGLLVPIRWEAWRYQRYDWTMRGGEPYIIDAVLAVLPGNRLYVKEWMLYPFMHELKSADDVEKMYRTIRQKIVDWNKVDNEKHRKWGLDILPPLEDMWKYKDGEYSCYEYASKILYGYQMK